MPGGWPFSVGVGQGRCCGRRGRVEGDEGHVTGGLEQGIETEWKRKSEGNGQSRENAVGSRNGRSQQGRRAGVLRGGEK